MSEYRFYHPIEIRYADLDAQRHVNNACYLTYMEQARLKYFQSLDLWDGADFDNIGVILVEQSCTYKSPIAYGQPIHVGVRVIRLGNKSLELTVSIRDRDTDQEMATGRTVLVAYDYVAEKSQSIPERWRETIKVYEGMA
ncbi:MAG: acyl-CoA thioesterase [Anaerolineaceae bacterium]|nr:MAG: acyl-CoA thioesterase [Anaerolineaceae bacterium]